MELVFLKPEFAWLIPFLLLACIAGKRLISRRFIVSTTLSLLSGRLERTSPVRRLPVMFTGLGTVLIIFALMEPVLPMAERELESQGLDIAIVLDLSESMQEVMDRENQPETQTREEPEIMTMTPRGRTRLMTTKDALRDFIIQRRDDRIGMIVFADNAYLVSPLTLDHDYLLHYLDMVDANILRNERKTAIGDGIALAYSLLMRQRGDAGRGRVIMVYTDGEHNHGTDPIEVLQRISPGGISVHLVGVDLEEKVKEREGVKRLIDRVRDLGGHYYNADTEDDLMTASSEIDKLEKGRVVLEEYVRQVPVYHWFVIPALFFLVLAQAFRVIPYFSNYT